MLPCNCNNWQARCAPTYNGSLHYLALYLEKIFISHIIVFFFLRISYYFSDAFVEFVRMSIAILPRIQGYTYAIPTPQ
jgi:hypothetical protein